ncbi:ATP-binding cassette domain-containing protein [Pseudarthrobacter raffinosi]|uniref:ATP-binding cassette domain-containing protein n=1 Tax=Pseudarthrobacter raffinosi TaxID=2953651 RepID=UPI00208E4EBD|nr:ATP-binding cassette domain-containing protein [Pseudarthrobacter sp. MDT3-9]MCO4253244.1 ATP-binding cassette domain-containing protein [Pseudarthrobacter sp. MDT3-9]
MNVATAPLLRVTDLEKHYGGVIALSELDLQLMPGEHAAVVGDNGAGKSTFVRMISGAERPDGGSIMFDGAECNFRSPLEARGVGIETVYQDLSLADDLDVIDNLFMGRELFHLKLGGLSILNRKAMRKRAHELLDEVGVRIPSLSGRIRGMSGGQRQGVAIARASGWGSKLIILDEPTAALGVRETGQVEDIIRGLKQAGTGVVLVSHNLRQVFDLMDTIYVFRRGKLVGRRDVATTTPQEIVAMITGVGGAEAGEFV